MIMRVIYIAPKNVKQTLRRMSTPPSKTLEKVSRYLKAGRLASRNSGVVGYIDTGHKSGSCDLQSSWFL